LITSCDAEGKPNIITLGEVFNLSIREPVWVGLAIRKATYSHGLISEQKEFVVNLPTAALLDQALQCGSVSARDGVDKFKEFRLTPVPAVHVKPPLVAECPVNIECRLVNVIEVGDHDLFIGDVLLEHVNDDLLDENGEWKGEAEDTIAMLRSGFYRTGKRITPTTEWPR
jgi:flavin reductase (DIM6/NTAB) family NADH-FMN oxidoreductase RutF